jgi:hypothetical protein
MLTDISMQTIVDEQLVRAYINQVCWSSAGQGYCALARADFEAIYRLQGSTFISSKRHESLYADGACESLSS